MNLHAKSGVCSSKNGWVMSTLYLCTFLYFCTFLFGNGCGRSRSNSMQNFGLLAQKLSELCSILFSAPIPSHPSRACDQPTCRAVRFAPANKFQSNDLVWSRWLVLVLKRVFLKVSCSKKYVSLRPAMQASDWLQYHL